VREVSIDRTGHGPISSPFNDGGFLSFTDPSNARFEVDSPTPIHFFDEHRPPLFADSDSLTTIILSSAFTSCSTMRGSVGGDRRNTVLDTSPKEIDGSGYDDNDSDRLNVHIVFIDGANDMVCM
jgi:hypothetical protein